MTGPARKKHGLWLRVAVSVGLLAVLLALLPWSEVRRAAGAVSAAVWFGVLGGFLAGHLLGVFKWRLLVNAIAPGLHPGAAVRCYSAGLFTNLCLPSIVGGDVLRAILAGRANGSLHAAVLGGITDRSLDMLGLGLLIGASCLAAGEALPEWARPLALIGGLGACAGVLALPLIGKIPLARWPRKLRRQVGRSFVSLRRLRRSPGKAGIALMMSLTIQCAFVLLNYWIGISVGVDIPLSAWFVAWPLAKLAGLMPVSLGGLGVRDGAFAALVVPFGATAAAGLVASLVWQSVLIGGGLLAGALWWWMGRAAR